MLCAADCVVYVQEAAGASDEFGANLTPIKSRRDFEQLIKGEGQHKQCNV
jgi:hypothetical protein